MGLRILRQRLAPLGISLSVLLLASACLTATDGSDDGGTSDGGTSDGGTADSGTTDSGTADSGTTDSGTIPPPVLDTFSYAAPAVDFLLVVDNSPNNPAYFGVLQGTALGLPALLDQSGLDWRVGATSADMESPLDGNSGALTLFQGQRWVDSGTTDAGALLQGLTPSGGYDSFDVRVFDAIQAFAGHSSNVGFLRPEAHLAVWVVSPEDDESLMDTASFVAWFQSSKDPAQGVSFHTLVGPLGMSVDPAWVSTGYRYHAARDQIGGVDGGDVGEYTIDAYARAFSAFVDGCPVPEQRFALSEVPEPSTLTVSGPLAPLQRDLEWRYEAVDNVVVITTDGLAAGAEIQVRYQAL